MQALSFILDDASETSKSTGVKAGRRKVDDSGKKKTDFSFLKKKRQNSDSFQSFLDELGLHNVNAGQFRSFRASSFYTRS